MQLMNYQPSFLRTIPHQLIPAQMKVVHTAEHLYILHTKCAHLVWKLHFHRLYFLQTSCHIDMEHAISLLHSASVYDTVEAVPQRT